MFAFVFAVCDGVGVLGGLHFIGFLSFEVFVVLLRCLCQQPKRVDDFERDLQPQTM